MCNCAISDEVDVWKKRAIREKVSPTDVLVVEYIQLFVGTCTCTFLFL